MKKLFLAIRHRDLAQAKEILKKKPELVNCTAKQPPKKDDGQSPLQVAFKTGNFEIAEYLIDSGANVNFMEPESVNEWRMPAVQDAIMATIMSSRYLIYDFENGKEVWVVRDTKEQFDAAFRLLKKMFDSGADIHSRDSYGNSCLGRAILDANRILPQRDYEDGGYIHDQPLNEELKEDLTLVFDLLFELGADINEYKKELEDEHLFKVYTDGYIAQFLRIIN